MVKIRPRVTPHTSATGAPASTAAPVKQAPASTFGWPAVDRSRTNPPPIADTPLPSLAIGMPAWVPSGFRLSDATQGMSRLLEQRGVDIAQVKRLVITDADFTLLETTAATMLKDKATGEWARNPETGEPLRLRSTSYEADRAALEARFPNLPWARYVYDFHEFDEALDIAPAKTIGPTLDVLKQSDATTGELQFLLTARSTRAAADALQGVSNREHLGLDGILSASRAEDLDALGLAGATLDIAQRKALIIATLVELYRPAALSFYDDDDENLVRAKELLPAMFPATKFSFVDVVAQANGTRALVER